MRDELRDFCGSDECFILNTDECNSAGTHWVAVNIAGASDASGDESTTYYFDSFGLKSTEEIKRYCKEPRFYNSFEFQKPKLYAVIYVYISSTECVIVKQISIRSWMSYTINKIKYYYII